MIIEMELSEFDVDTIHDMLFEVIGERFSDQSIDDILNDLPSDLKSEIAEWGVQDTDVLDALFEYFDFWED